MRFSNATDWMARIPFLILTTLLHNQRMVPLSRYQRKCLCNTLAQIGQQRPWLKQHRRNLISVGILREGKGSISSSTRMAFLLRFFSVVILEIDRECLRWGDHAHMATCQGLL